MVLTNGQVVSVIGINTTTGCQGASTTTFTMSVVNCYTYSGEIVYKNTAETKMGNVGLTLTGVNATFTTTTSVAGGSVGTFSFTNLPADTYTLTYATNKTHGGINATDAFRVILHAINFAPLTGLNSKAGDVNVNTTILADDALLIARRFVGLDNSFPSGNWAFESVNFAMSGDLTNQKIYALAYGDVNGSFTPNSTESIQPTVFFVGGENMNITNGQNIVIPIRTDKAAAIGAMSLAMTYPTQGMTINNVTLPNGQNVLYNIINDELRIAHTEVAGLNLANGDVIFNIHATIDDAIAVVNNPMMLNDISEIANITADAFSFIELRLPTFTTTTTNTNTIANEVLNVNHAPNPFRENVTITYNLPNTSEVSIIVTDVLGRQVRTLVNATQTAGEQQVNFEARNLPAGI
ncbi:MAG: hypothetical protein HC803_03765 [Saprospiraceae bacterium]|nr:hypothetical protein [Saprospiraceae bacterium]